jgi:hypothetical protein
MTFTINGVRDSGEWSAATRLDYAPGASPPGYSLYGTIDGDGFVFSLQSAVAIGFDTTIWLNTDHNNATGYRIFNEPTGVDFNVDFINQLNLPVPALNATGASSTTSKGTLDDFAFSTDRQGVEFRVPFSALGIAAPLAITDVFADVNNSTYLPANYSLPGYELVDPATLPARTDLGLKVGIVYSETSAAKFFDTTAYSQLFMAAQNQATMAGVPYDILTEADLTNLAKIVNYDTLIFPSFSHVPLATYDAIGNNLETAAYKYGVGIITAGNFMTNDETGAVLPGDVYARMKVLLGVNVEGATSVASNVQVVAQDISHPVMSGYTAGETIHDYTGIGSQWFTPIGANATVLASQVVGPATTTPATHNAVLATEAGGRNVHFATESLLADNNMLAHALNWTAQDLPQPNLQLHMSRQAAIVASRTDMDEAMQLDEVDPAGATPGIYDVMLPILQNLKNTYNFVGSYYIDTGDGTGGTGTDWIKSKPYYDQLLAMGNEIGSHSITHPSDTNTLTPAELQYQFQQSKSIIEQNLGINVLGAAIPGNPEKSAVSQEVMKYYSYMTGGNTAIGAGYPGAFGYMLPGDTQKVYLAPNISSDFTLIGFKQMTTAQAEAAWTAEWNVATAHAELPVVVWPWHDYGLTHFNIDNVQDPSTIQYAEQMYTGFIKTAYDAGSEFVTLADLAQRISASEKATLNYSMVDTDTMSVAVGSAGALGSFALDLDGQNTIKAVSGWYAYDSDSVFLPAAGGNFTIDLGPVPDNVTHITSLPSRAQLLAATSPGRGGLDFSVVGEGTLLVDLEAVNGRSVVVTNAETISLTAEILTLKLTGLGQHNVSVRLVPAAPTIGPVTDDVEPVTGALANGGSTNDPDLAVQVSLTNTGAVAGDTVHLYEGSGTTLALGTAYALLAADISAGFATLQTGPLATGVHAITARVTDLAGNQSLVSTNTFTVTETAIVPTAPSTPDLIATSDSGTSSLDNITNDTTPTFIGTATAGYTVNLFDNSTNIGTGTVAADGTWSITAAAALTSGAHSVTATQTDLAGNVSTASAPLAVTLDTTASSEVVSITSMAKDSGVPGDFVTSDGSADRSVSGTLSAALATDETLQVSFDGGSTWTGGAVNGTNWTATDSTAHSASWIIQARAVDLAGNIGQIASQAVTLQPLQPKTPVSEFDTAYYLAQNPDVAAAGIDPFTHFNTYGWQEGRNPDAFFSTRYYLNQNPDVAAARINPLTHYAENGWKEGRDPSSEFSSSAYINANPDVAAAHIDPLMHYLAYGAPEGRISFAAQPHGVGPQNPLVDNAYYFTQYADVRALGLNPLTHYNAFGWHEGRNPDSLFNTQGYLQHNQDVQAAGTNPLFHYDQFGWKEGRDPSAEFSTQKYLSANADVLAAGIDPLVHYTQFGQSEGRAIFASDTWV